MMKKLFLMMTMCIVTSICFAQTPTDGDYRSVISGNWTDASTWQVRVSGNWQAASSSPSSTNNVYLQTGHAIVIDAPNVYCNSLHWGFNGSVYGSVTLGTNDLNVSGKVRVYTGHTTPITATGADGTFYSGQNSSTATNAAQFNSPSTSGHLKFIGDTRVIADAGEWNSSGTTCYGVFALNSGETGTIITGMKFRGLEFESGNIVSSGIMAVGSSAGTGNVTIKNGSKFTSSRSTQVLTYASNGALGTIDIQNGGTLELTNSNPEINCTSFINNGTVIYSGSNQNFVVPNGSIVAAIALTTYNNLTVNTSTVLNVTAGKNITLSGALNFMSGKLAIPSNSTLELTAGNTAVVGGDASKYIQTLVSGSAIGVLKVSGLSTAKTFPVGSSANYLPVNLLPTTSSSFNISVFEGATVDATPNGTSLTLDQKKRIVDAIWNIDRTSGSGDVDVTLTWVNALEGTEFSTYTDLQIGIASYNGGSYGVFTGVGNAAANTATITLSSLSPFIVGEANTTLPLRLLKFDATASLNSVKLTWQTTSEVNLKNYVLQHYINNGFEDIYSVSANNKPGIFNYGFTHSNSLAGENYYRLMGIDNDGTKYIFDQKSVNLALVSAVSVYPNPVTGGNINVRGVANGDIIKVLNQLGQVVATQSVKDSNIQQINVHNMPAGIYLLSVESAGKIIGVSKIIKL